MQKKANSVKTQKNQEKMFNSTDNFFRNVCVADFHRFYMSNTNTYCILQPFITTLQNLLDNT